MKPGLAGWVWSGAALLAGLIAWSAFQPGHTIRYRMTVEVETPSGLRTGSAVREVTYDDGKAWNWLPPFMWLGEQRPQWRLTGEAVVVDLPDERTLFALLPSASGLPDLSGQGIWSIFRQTGLDEVELWPSAPSTNSPQIREPWPMLVQLDDPTNPLTIKAVDPHNIGGVFGRGYSLKRVVVQVTRDPVTRLLSERLPWLERHTERSINKNPGLRDFSVAATVRHGHFWRGIE